MIIKLSESRDPKTLSDYKDDYTHFPTFPRRTYMEDVIDQIRKDGFKLVDAIYKDANHNRQSYQYIFYQPDDRVFLQVYRNGDRDNDSADTFTVSRTIPKSKKNTFDKIVSYDRVHDIADEPDYFQFKDVLDLYDPSIV